MKVKKIITTILISAIVIVAAYFYSFNKKTAVFSEVLSDIPVNESLEVSYVLPEDNVYGIILNISDCTKSEGTIRYTVTDENGVELTSKETVTEETIEFKFDRIKDSKGKKINIKIECDEGEKLVIAKDSTFEYMYKEFRLETMIVSILCVAYLFGLAKVLNLIFRK